jgi:O-antigen/teichoic acid export membrane protein
MVSRFQRDTYYVTLLLAAGATILLIAPAAYHRIVFRQHDKRHLVFTSNLLAIAGLTCLALAMCGVVLLITDVLFGGATAAVATGATGLAFALLWYALPLGRRARGGR